MKREIDFEGLHHSKTGNDWLEFSAFICVCVCVSLVSVMERFLVTDTLGLHTYKHVEKGALMHREEYCPSEMFWYLMKAVLYYHGNST